MLPHGWVAQVGSLSLRIHLLSPKDTNVLNLSDLQCLAGDAVSKKRTIATRVTCNHVLTSPLARRVIMSDAKIITNDAILSINCRGRPQTVPGERCVKVARHGASKTPTKCRSRVTAYWGVWGIRVHAPRTRPGVCKWPISLPIN